MKTVEEKKQQNNRSGFSLIELLVVMVILGVIGGIAVGQFGKEGDKAKVKAARASFITLENSLERYKLDMGSYPTEDDGLIALLEAPEDDESGDWGGPYLKKRSHLKDGWGNEYLYQVPASNGDDFELICLGGDGQEGGEKFNADLSNIEYE